MLRCAVGGSSGGEDHSFCTGRAHGFQQAAGATNAAAPVHGGLRHGLTNQRVGGKVQHCIGALLGEQRGKRGAFAQIELCKAQAALGNGAQGIDGTLMTARQ